MAARPTRFRGLLVEALEERRVLSTVSPWGGGTLGSGPEGEAGIDYKPDQLLMEFERGVTDTQRDQILSEQGATVIHEYQSIPWVLVQLADGSGDMNAVATVWSDLPSVKYAEPNYVIEARGVPNDYYFALQWDMNNVGQSLGTPDADVDAPEAWDLYTGSSETVVAIIDSGIYYSHPDLYDNMWRNPGEVPNNQLDDDGNGYVDDVFGIDTIYVDSDPIDGAGHGTHVAGTVGAVGNNGIGVAGMNWDVQLMAVQILDDSGAGTLAAGVEGIDYVTMMRSQYGINVLVSNNSWGFAPGAFPAPPQVLVDAIAAHTAADILFVAAAGNDTNNNDAIASYPDSIDLPGIVSVAATDDYDLLAWYSNYGVNTVDLAAPGGALIANFPQADILSTLPPPLNYDFYAGTSMASPHVAGVAALVRGYAPTLNHLETKQLILDNVDILPSLNGLVGTGGRLNAFKCLAALEPFEIHGRVWSDVDSDGLQDPTEQGIGNWTVYVDLNQNSRRDAGEPTAVTAADGTYVLESTAGPGTYTIAQVLQPNWTQTYPAGKTHTVRINQYGQVIQNINFGNHAVEGGVSGVKWNDLNGDGIHDPDEPGMKGVYIYVDLDDNGRIAIGEPSAVTDADGYYRIKKVPPGDWKVREVQDPGWVTTYPAIGYHEVSVGANATTPNIDFGNAALVDLGDAPAPYLTLLEDNGAVHGVLPGFGLGLLIDGEINGIPNGDAEGDDLTDLDDEDGVVMPAALFADKTATILVTVNTGDYSAGALQGWIDFDGDGVWEANEQIIKDRVLDDVVDQPISFHVPTNAKVGPSFARFRYGYERGIGPTGPAMAGEVEDYAILILKDQPVANDDRFEVDQDSGANTLDVLANDYPSSTGVLAIVGVTQPSPTGIANVTPSPDNQTLVFTPVAGKFGTTEFTYTIGDGTGKTSTARVTVFVQRTIENPVAVDDAYRILVDETELKVLANDLPGVSGTMKIISWTNPATGTLTPDDNGTPNDTTDDYFKYSIDQNNPLLDVDQFTYTIQDTDNLNLTDTATVTLFKDPAPAGQDVLVFVEARNSLNQPVSQVLVGEEFDLVVSVQDTRFAQTGVAAVYLDILYDWKKVSIKGDSDNELGFDITYAKNADGITERYGSAKSGDARTQGIVDEVGGFQTSGNPLGSSKLEVFRITVIADAVGEVEFTGDPADILPEHDILYFQPPEPVLLKEINYGFATVEIVSGSTTGQGAGLDDRDVNGDGHITPLDALLIINRLNSYNTRPGGEGERSLSDTETRLDVNRDSVITPLDALLVINYLNRPVGGGEGEGEAGLPAAVITTAAAQGDLLGDPTAGLDTLAEVPVIDGLPPVVLTTPSAAAEVDWALTIGEAAQPQQQVSADRVVDQSWNSLLDDIAEDVLGAWLDGEDA